MPVIPGLGRMRCKDHNLEAIVSYQRDPVSKKSENVNK
jgi:hypothetical protein